MANLTEVSIMTRKLIVWTIVLSISYIVVKFSFDIGKGYWRMTHPVAPPPPDVKFGKIKPPKFTHIVSSSSGLKFNLINIEGRPPEATNSAMVYQIPKKLLTLLSSQKAIEIAKKLGFEDKPKIENQTIYNFSSAKQPNSTLSVEIVNLSYYLKYNYANDPKLFDKLEPLNKDAVLDDTINFLTSNYLFDDTILKGKTALDLLNYDSKTGKFMATKTQAAAKAIRVNFFKNDLNGYKLVTPEYFQSYNYAIYVLAKESATKITEISYFYTPIDEGSPATYPLKTSVAAWQDLADGYASVISMGNNTPDNIIIRNIYVAYYDSDETQDYLEPVFVFEGDNDFIAYVPAIAPEWLEQ